MRQCDLCSRRFTNWQGRRDVLAAKERSATRPAQTAEPQLADKDAAVQEPGHEPRSEPEASPPDAGALAMDAATKHAFARSLVGREDAPVLFVVARGCGETDAIRTDWHAAIAPAGNYSMKRRVPAILVAYGTQARTSSC